MEIKSFHCYQNLVKALLDSFRQIRFLINLNAPFAEPYLILLQPLNNGFDLF
jgi:hypothetical protein